MEQRLRAWAEATATCLALMRAGLRSRHPRMTSKGIERALARELARRRRVSDAAYQRG